jgi:hypothetical protein
MDLDIETDDIEPNDLTVGESTVDKEGKRKSGIPYFYTHMVSVKDLIERMQHGHKEEIRNPVVPTIKGIREERKGFNFLEALIIGVPVQGLVLRKSHSADTYRVVDGKKRINTLQRFTEDQITLEDMGFIPAVNGLRYSTLTPAYRRAFLCRKVIVHTLNPKIPAEEKVARLIKMVRDSS